MERGCVWNSFVIAGTALSFLKLIRKASPALFASFTLPQTVEEEKEALSSIYSGVPIVDFSGAVLASCPDDLAVVPASRTGWSDLGSPERT